MLNAVSLLLTSEQMASAAPTATAATAPTAKEQDKPKADSKQQPAKPAQALSTVAFPLKHVTLHPAVAALSAELSATRRHLHAHPELSLMEVKTAKFVAERLRYVTFDVML
jgi:hypothetical protein